MLVLRSPEELIIWCQMAAAAKRKRFKSDRDVPSDSGVMLPGLQGAAGSGLS